MLAAVFHGPEDLRVEEVPMPEIGPEEILLKVLDANICGTDLRIYTRADIANIRREPRAFPVTKWRARSRHWATECEGYEPGQRFFIAPNMGRGDSRATVSGNNNLDPEYQAFGITLDGAFAEYMRLPR